MNPFYIGLLLGLSVLPLLLLVVVTIWLMLAQGER